MTHTDIDALIDAQSSNESDLGYGADPYDERYAMRTADRAVDAAALAELPQAFLAYLDYEQSRWR